MTMFKYEAPPEPRNLSPFAISDYGVGLHAKCFVGDVRYFIESDIDQSLQMKQIIVNFNGHYWYQHNYSVIDVVNSNKDNEVL